MVIWVKIVQTELMEEICSKHLVRAIGKVFFMKFSQNTNNKPEKVAFVCKQTAVLVVGMNKFGQF